MEPILGIDNLPPGLRFVATIGVFDGVHRGHQALLSATVSTAHKLEATPVIVTFRPHPDEVLRGDPPVLLCDPDEQLARLEAVGATVVVQQFDHQFAAQSAAEFVDRLARGRALTGLVLSTESVIGHDREGTATALKTLAAERDLTLVQIPPLSVTGERISSTRIREQIGRGQLSEAARLLGRPYAVVGSIVPGDQRGRELGFPTANFGFDPDPILPPNGIYAVRLSWGGPDPLHPTRNAIGVASLGIRPVFGGGRRVLEAYLFDLDEDLYGERMRCEFVRRQRGEWDFPDATALIEQMDRDVIRAREILAGSDPSVTG